MPKKREKQVAVVRCNGGGHRKMKTDPGAWAGNCAQIAEAYPDGIAECAFGCLGGGSCAEACRAGAVYLDPGRVARIDREKCLGCGRCVKACPQGIIGLALAENTLAPRCANRAPGAQARKQCAVSCLACRICEKNCPAEAIAVIDHCAVIDQKTCIACGLCAVKCPRGVILDADGIFAALG
ncbi:MAG: 4Fe-4S binding protein [Candidatus Adiutrix sp.]|jgi:Fe-S-cluster-containing hydrogenase component 2|nr:4Fe-4S binding protein [Candidatus Adiutrix sp.]